MLRVALENNIAKNNTISTHVTILEELRKEYLHDIKINYFDMSIECNCVMYALNLNIKPASSISGRFYANTKFVKYLIDSFVLKERNAPVDGDMVVYFNSGNVVHIGVGHEEGRVLSKWGIGNLYDHQTLQVPSSYGDCVRRFACIDSDVAHQYLTKFYSGTMSE